jgi:ArsR family transcriptional regulator, arsenate/arsenite/antimonite-responsive transcriptional repressor
MLLTMQRTTRMRPFNHPFRALGDETRREILRLLRHGPLTSGDIAERFDSSWPTISRHLAVLRDADLVTTERRGQEIRYELNTSVFQDLIHLLIEWTRPQAVAARRTAKPRRTRKQEA